MASNVDKYGRELYFIYDVMYENFLKNGKWDEKDYHPVFYVTAENEDDKYTMGDDYFVIHEEDLVKRYGKGDINDAKYVDQVYEDREYWINYFGINN